MKEIQASRKGKIKMKKNLLHIFSVSLIAVLFSATTAFAQQQEDRRMVSAASSLYVISAKAGAVNFVEGKVTVARQNGKSGYLLKGDELEIGDRVSTGAGGKAEILLNPGSFVRLAENSVFEFATTSSEDLQLKLGSGSAMFEVITDDEFTFAVNTPKANFYIVKSGVYRVDVLGDGAGKIEVWKGRANAGRTEIKSGKQATVNGNQTATLAKFDRDEKDALEVWSKSRAKELAKINARLQNNLVRTSLMSSYWETRWNMYNSYGLWIFSRYDNSYCFLPFGYGWSSPYGFFYPRDIWYYNLPPVIYNPPVPNPMPTTTTQPPISSPGSTITSKIRNSRGNREGDAVRIVPPYQRVQKEIGQFPTEGQGDIFSSPSISAPVRNSSAPSSSSIPSAPALIVISPTEPLKKGGN
jgi:hypothetical protein